MTQLASLGTWEAPGQLSTYCRLERGKDARAHVTALHGDKVLHAVCTSAFFWWKTAMASDCHPAQNDLSKMIVRRLPKSRWDSAAGPLKWSAAKDGSATSSSQEECATACARWTFPGRLPCRAHRLDRCGRWGMSVATEPQTPLSST